MSRSGRLASALILLGAALRIHQYLFNRALWVDEVFLALNILRRPFSALTGPLDYDQGAPVGFLFVEKGLVNLLGGSEYVLRLFPLAAGLLSLVLLYRVARRALDADAVPIALALFALADPLIYYASELKQYSSDVAATLVILLLASPLVSRRATAREVIVFGLAGALVVWFSHPAALVLGGCGIALGLPPFLRKEWGRLGRLCVTYALWGAGFLTNYLLALRSLMHQSSLHGVWASEFMPFPPKNVGDFQWILDHLIAFFRNPIGLPLLGLSLFFFVIGCVAFAREDRDRFALLLGPFLVTLVASFLRVYPFYGRFLLFLAPIAFLLIAKGVILMIHLTRDRFPAFGFVAVFLLLFQPALGDAMDLRRPRTREEIRPALECIRDRMTPEDRIYVYYGAKETLEYYAPRYRLDLSRCVFGVMSRLDWNAYRDDLEKLRGNRRVWVLFSHVSNWNGADEEKLILYFLDGMGARRDSLLAPGVRLYLYDLSGQAPTRANEPARRPADEPPREPEDEPASAPTDDSR